MKQVRLRTLKENDRFCINTTKYVVKQKINPQIILCVAFGQNFNLDPETLVEIEEKQMSQKVKIEVEIEIPEGYEVGCRNHIIKKGDMIYNLNYKIYGEVDSDQNKTSPSLIYLKPKQLTFGDLKVGDKFKDLGLPNFEFIKIHESAIGKYNCYYPDDNKVISYENDVKVTKLPD